MRTIETIATVNEDGTLVVRAPGSMSCGQHRVVIVIEETPVPASRTQRQGNMAAFRDSLGIPTYAGNSVVDMREEERP